MQDTDKIYGIVTEWKDDAPIVMEGGLMTREAAYQRMNDFKKRADVIRVAMFKAIYETGNKTLIPQESEICKITPF